jgi:cation diffusion facilitator family transporter
MKVMDHCCENKAEEIARLRHRQGRVLKIVLAINAAMFFTEFTAGVVARSTALMADSVDMLGDALVYVLSLYVIDRGLRWRAGAAVAKGLIILVFGLWILIEAGLKVMEGTTPISTLMAAFGTLALIANLVCLRLLWPLRSQDVNMRSTFECSRNDVIANVGVLFAALGVWFTGRGWSDILVGLIVAALFLRSAMRVLREAWPQLSPSATVE